MTPKKFSQIPPRLLRWYQKHRRDLPWRRTTDPYAIWVSEIMLQQTQVATVLPYYEKFLRAFPTVHALDRAPLARVLSIWSGLGYYRRAENLKKAARQIVSLHGAAVPCDYAALRQLPGIGDYTAGALLSIAFQKPYPAADGNVRRVLGRVFARGDGAVLRKIAASLVPNSRPGKFNQALMELGATVCTPNHPRCSACPLSSHCAAQRRGGATLTRQLGRPRRYVTVIWPLAIIRRRGKTLLRQRDTQGLLARLWELPGGAIGARRSAAALLKNELRPLRCRVERLRRLGEIRHSITHRRIRAPIYIIDCAAGEKFRLPDRHWRWIDPRSLDRHAVSSMTAKALKLLPS